MSDLLATFRARAAAAGGRVAAVVVDGDGREVFAIEPDEVMPAASVIKLPLVMTLYADAAGGRSSLEERVAVGTRVGGSGVLGQLADVEALSLRDLAALTMTVSDNTAANRLIDRVGIDRVNERLDAWACPKTRLRRAMFDLEAKARGLENVMTAREAASLLARVQRDAASGDGGSAWVLKLLEWNSNDSRLGRYLPKGVVLAHKDGWGDSPEWCENDAGVIRATSSAIAVGLTRGIAPIPARALLGLLGLAAAEIAGADVREVPPETRG